MGDGIQEGPISFKPEQASGVEELAGASPVAMNVILDGAGAVRRRPGMADYQGRTQSASGDQILGLYESAAGELFSVRQVGALRHVMRVTSTAESDQSTMATGTYLPGLQRPVFAETEDRVVCVGGDKPVQWSPSGGVTTLLGGTPPKATHVIANSSRLLLNDTTQFPWLTWFSDVSGGADGGYQAWNAASPSIGTGSASSFQALPNREAELAMTHNGEQVLTWGRTSMRLFVPADPPLYYSPEAAHELGISAPSSVVRAEENLAWLDHRRRFVVSDGRSYKIVSTPSIQETLNDIATVDDCFGWRFLHGNTDVMVWTFPTDGRTFVFDPDAGWCQWSGWNGSWQKLPVLSHVFRQSTGENVVGTVDGRYAEFNQDITTDFGLPILATVTSGFLDRGTARLKASRAVRITMRRGNHTSSTEPVGTLSWRDDLGEFTPGIQVGFGSPTDKTAVVRFTSLGTYRKRQWKWTFSGENQMILADVREEFEVLGS